MANTLSTHQLVDYEEKVEQHYLSVNTFLRKLQSRGSIMRNKGGTSYSWDIRNSSKPQLRTVGRLEKLKRADSEDYITATESYADYHGHAILDGLDKQKNKGKWAIRDMREQTLKDLEADMNEDMAGEFHNGDGTALNGGGGIRLTGLTSVIIATPTSTSVYGVNRATYSGFRNQTTDGNAGPNSDFDIDAEERIQTTVMQCTRKWGGKEKPDVLLGTRANIVNLTRQTIGTFTGVQMERSDDFVYYGLEMSIDDDISGNVMYVLNMSTWELRLTGARLFEFYRRTNLPDYHPKTEVFDYFFQGLLVCKSMRNNGYVSNAN